MKCIKNSGKSKKKKALVEGMEKTASVSNRHHKQKSGVPPEAEVTWRLK